MIKKNKVTKKSFQYLCKDKLMFLKLQVCRTEIEELIYDLGICKTSTTTVKRTLKKFYERANNLSTDTYNKIFNDTK